MKTAADQLDRMDALVQKLANYPGVLMMAPDAMIWGVVEAKAILAERAEGERDREEAKAIATRRPFSFHTATIHTIKENFEEIVTAIERGIQYGRTAAKGNPKERFVTVHTTIRRFVESENIQMSVTAESRLTRDILAALDK